MDNGLIDLLTKLERAQTANSAWADTSDFLTSLGLPLNMYAFGGDIHKGGAPWDFWTSRPDWWMTRYVEEGYCFNDHALNHCLTNIEPLRFGIEFDLRRNDLDQRYLRVARECAETGFRSAMTIPLRSCGGSSVGAVTFGASTDAGSLEAAIAPHWSTIQLAGLYAHAKIQQLRTRDLASATGLTRREKEVLLWLALGQRPEQISDRLGIARVTVDFHIRSARRKLSAATREQAVANAILLGLINP